MSEKSRCSELRKEIFNLDAQFPARYTPTKCNAAERLWSWLHNSGYLREIYETGCVRRSSLPAPPAPAIGIPEELFEAWLTNRPKTAEETPMEIPDELLWPKRKRGRPRNESLYALANSQRCSERHARRLLSSGKQRELVREGPDSAEAWALQQREKRRALVQALREEDTLNHIAYALDILHRGLKTWCLSPDVSPVARLLAAKMIENYGVDAALLICGFASGDGVRFVSITLGMSRSTIYRKFRGKLRSLRTSGECLADALRNVDSSKVDAVIRSKPRRRLVRESENAWSARTTWQPRTQRRTH